MYVGRLVGFAKFLFAGLINTGVTYAIYAAFLTSIGYKLAYTVAFVSGIALGYALNRYFVFCNPGRKHAWFLYPIIYFVQYGIGLTVVWIWVRIFGWPPILAPLAAILLTIPINYLLVRTLFGDPPVIVKFDA